MSDAQVERVMSAVIEGLRSHDGFVRWWSGLDADTQGTMPSELEHDVKAALGDTPIDESAETLPLPGWGTLAAQWMHAHRAAWKAQQESAEEIARLKKKLAGRPPLGRLRDTVKPQAETIERLRDALRRLEWIDERCSVCEGPGPTQSHGPRPLLS